MECAYVDIARNVEVPAPTGPDISTAYQQVVTSGPGPVLIKSTWSDDASNRYAYRAARAP